MNEKIINVYKFKSKNGEDSFVYSCQKQADFLGYSYYILTQKENGEPIVYDAGNTIKTLQHNGIRLIKVKKDTTEYDIFLSELKLFKELNDFSKQGMYSRK